MTGKRKHARGASKSIESASKRQQSSFQEHPALEVISHPLLSLYYPRVATLRTFLLARLPRSSRARKKKILQHAAWNPQTLWSCSDDFHTTKLGTSMSVDAPELNEHHAQQQLARILDTTLIGFCDKAPVVQDESVVRELVSFTQKSQQFTHTVSDSTSRTCVRQCEVVDFAIWRLFHRSYPSAVRPPHVLCHGFSRAADSSQHGESSIMGLQVQSRNTQVDAIKSQEWQDLLQLIGKEGDAIMLDMIWHCGVFVKVESGKDNFYQLSGTPLPDLQTLSKKDGLYDSKPENIYRAARTKSSKRVLRSPSDIVFVRNRIMYARPALNTKEEVRSGLPYIHALNRCSGKHRSSAASLLQGNNPLEPTVHLMKYMFPRQFGLHNVFTSMVNRKETTHLFKDYTVREDEIENIAKRDRLLKGERYQKIAVHLPRRLRGLCVTLVRRMQTRHARCAYVELLKHYCHFEYIDGRDSQMSRKKSQRRPGSFASASAQKLGGSGEGGSRDLTDAATPVSSVSAFCRAVVANIMPLEFFGYGLEGKQNWGLLMQGIDRFVRCRRHEKMSLHTVSHKIKLSKIAWLAPPDASRADKLSKSDSDKRREIFLELLYYVFDSLLIPLLRSHFHITESSSGGNCLFFFRHDVWRALTEPSLNRIKTTMLEEIPISHARKMMGRRTLGFSHIRLVPKKDSVRPLMNMKRKSAVVTKQGQVQLGNSINDTLKPVSNMLNFEKLRHSDLLGASLFSIGEIYPRLSAYRSKLKPHVAGRPEQQLYLVKVDVQKCFDTIPQDKMMSLMRTLCSDGDYKIEKHAEIRASHTHGYFSNTSNTYPAKRFPALARTSGDDEPFQEVVRSKLAPKKRGTFFVDFGLSKRENGRDLLKLLEEHLQQNTIKIGKKFYRQKQGIPQGSSVSTLLCNLFYADFEREHLGFLDSDESLMSRLIDDFLLITTNKQHAEQFLRIMHDGNEQYGITVKAEKSLASFPCTVDGIPIKQPPADAAFPYCGIALDPKTLEVTKDMNRRLDSSLRNSLTVDAFRVPGQAFYQKSIKSFKNQLYAMLTDTNVNSQCTVLSTLHLRFMETAMKMHRYLKSLPRGKRPHNKLVIKAADDLIDVAFVLVKGKQHGLSTGARYNCAVSKAQVEWLAAAAFRQVLSSKQSSYSEVLAWLEGKKKAARLVGLKEASQLERIAMKGLDVFGGYKF